MHNSLLLNGKRAVVFGAGGSIGSAVAREFAAEGAQVFLAGRSLPGLESTARSIAAAGGGASTSTVDATDDDGVNRYLDTVVEQAGGIDILFDASGPLARDYGNTKFAAELSLDEFMTPLTTIVKARFITARAASRHMARRNSGVIILLSGSPARGHVPGATAIGAAFGAIENLVENLAFEVSPQGVRVVGLRTTANVDSRTIQDTTAAIAGRLNISTDQAINQMAQLNFLKVPATVQDTANAAVLLACDRARMLTATVVNATAGAALD